MGRRFARQAIKGDSSSTMTVGLLYPVQTQLYGRLKRHEGLLILVAR